MFKRIRWTLFGALLGAGGSIWARRRVKRTVRRYLPEQLSTQARRWLSIAGDDLRSAMDEGRAAMEEREAELRTRFAEGMVAQPVQRGRIIDADPAPAPAPHRPPAAVGPHASPPPAPPHPTLRRRPR